MKMKKIHKRFAAAMITLVLAGFSTYSFAQAPPGQVKKATGSKSAAPYAPGQQKKTAESFPLIVLRGQGIEIKIWNDGREYYKNKDGAMYWKGSDGRFYLEDKYRDNTIQYSSKDVEDWEKGKGKSKSAEKGSKENKGEKEKKGS
jgi:hypothetical protein